ncbi:pathogenesis-related 5 protein Cup a 3 [Lolium perenne]|uniref:pathogenesis-related 5 protein Cup a 3 n=1 Tax=Lolium perenne TaxID=4522 RepID=UPI0021EAD62E|nr:pathogenesis-related 5 protein Cup a 3-like [Lolium perenne]
MHTASTAASQQPIGRTATTQAMASSRVLQQIALLLLVAAAATHAATITVVNKCSYTVWPAALPGGGVRLDPGQTWPLTMPAGTAAARVWPRTGCTFNGSGVGRCITGDCAGKLACALSGEQPTTIAEYTLGNGDPDFFDLSLVDGFNVPMRFQPLDGAPCRAASCSVDITKECLPELKVAGGCASSCGKFGGDTYCCRGQFAVNCPPTNYSMFFKSKCPDAYSYAKDDKTSTFTCPTGTNYQIVLCP